MPYLIDSDIVIDFLNSQEPAIKLFKNELRTGDIFISIISWMEIGYGFKKIKVLKKLVYLKN